MIGGVAQEGATPPSAVDMLLTDGVTSGLSEFRQVADAAGLAVRRAGPQAGRYVVEPCLEERNKRASTGS